jgi:glycerophosphoryl diester phosphodiesterase
MQERHGKQRAQRAAAVLALLALAHVGAAAFDLQGHRGARGLAPENTLPAFEVALRHGVSTLEMDVAVTRDGVVVVHHDLALNPDLARGPDGRWIEPPGTLVHALTWPELQTYDVGRIRPDTRYASLYPDQVPVDGTRVPRLADVFDLLERGGHAQVRLSIEIKSDPRRPEATLPPVAFAQTVVDAVRRAGMIGRVDVQSFDWRTLQAVQRLAPDLPTVYLTARQRWLDNIGADGTAPSPWTAGIAWRDHGSVPKMVHRAGGRIWSSYHGDLDESTVREAKQLGLKVLAWTVNDPAAMERLIDLGVDGLITDRPDLARRVLKARGLEPR